MTKKPKSEEDLTYTAASAELTEILDEIEAGSIDIDVLSGKVERAAHLVRFCRERLSQTEMRVTKVLEQLETDDRETDEQDQE